jgi:hypothetical protein
MADINDIKQIINNPNTVKIVGTVGTDGVPHTAVKQSLHLNNDGRIEYVELFESSKSYRNVTGSIWYNKKVSISILSENKESYEIVGEIERILIAGKEYEKVYTKVLEEKGYDIAAVVLIVPETIENNSPKGKFEEQEKTRLFYKHLDRFSKQQVAENH